MESVGRCTYVSLAPPSERKIREKKRNFYQTYLTLSASLHIHLLPPHAFSSHLPPSLLSDFLPSLRHNLSTPHNSLFFLCSMVFSPSPRLPPDARLSGASLRQIKRRIRPVSSLLLRAEKRALSSVSADSSRLATSASQSRLELGQVTQCWINGRWP